MEQLISNYMDFREIDIDYFSKIWQENSVFIEIC